MANLDGMRTARSKHCLPVLGRGRNGKDWGGNCAKGWVEEGTRTRAFYLKVRRVFSQNDDGWTNRCLVIRDRWEKSILGAHLRVFP